MGVIPGVDTYFIPDSWVKVKGVYLVPFKMINASFRMAGETKLRKYSSEFDVLPPDTSKGSVNPRQRRLVLKPAPLHDCAIVVSVVFEERDIIKPKML